MTAQLQSPSVPAPNRPYDYDHVPLLRELLPKQHGRPGFTYAQVCVVNQRRAEDQGWSRVDGTATYTIIGPKGTVDMTLMAKGKPIRGVGHASGKRTCVVDLAVEQATGHLVKSKPLNTTTTNGDTNAGKINEPKERGPVQRSEQAKAG